MVHSIFSLLLDHKLTITCTFFLRDNLLPNSDDKTAHLNSIKAQFSLCQQLLWHMNPSQKPLYQAMLGVRLAVHQTSCPSKCRIWAKTATKNNQNIKSNQYSSQRTKRNNKSLPTSLSPSFSSVSQMVAFTLLFSCIEIFPPAKLSATRVLQQKYYRLPYQLFVLFSDLMSANHKAFTCRRIWIP